MPREQAFLFRYFESTMCRKGRLAMRQKTRYQCAMEHTSLDTSLPELAETDFLVIVLVQDLGCCQIEILLRNMYSSFS